MNIFVDFANYILTFIDNPSDEVKALVVAFSLTSPIFLALFVMVVVDLVQRLKRKKSMKRYSQDVINII